MRRSAGLRSISPIRRDSGKTATVQAEVCTRPWLSVAGHALHAMAPRFKLEFGVGAFADDADDDFLVAAEFAVVFGDDLRLPAMIFGVAQVHPKQVSGKEGGFVAAGAGTNFKENVAAVVGILGQEQDLKLVFDDVELFLCFKNLFLGECLHLRIFQHFLSSADVHVDGFEFKMLLHDRFNVGALLRERAEF